MRRTGPERAVTSVGDLVFVLAFTVYASVAAALLLSGLGAAVGSASTATQTSLASWGQGGGPAAEVFGGMARAADHPHHPGQVGLDYLVSAVNLALGLFVLWLRPRDWTARLLGIGLVGTAAAFNLTSHDLFFVLADRPVNVAHFLLHAVSGVAYLHAVLLFPDGRLPSGWPRQVLRVVYGLTAVEVAFIALAGVGVNGAGPLSVLALFAASPFQADQLRDLTTPGAVTVADVVAADAAFFLVFFGLLVPVLGLVAQVQRYRRAERAEEREQSRLFAWALTVAATAGVAFVVYAVTAGVAGAAGVPVTVLERVESWAFRLFPLLLAVIPVALFAGLLRYRLWDVDRVVNTALVYGAVTGLLGGCYLLLVGGLGWLVDAVSGRRLPGFAVGFSMLGVALLFQPFRRRVQDAVDRRFYRRRVDVTEALHAFGERVADEVEVGRVNAALVNAVNDTVQPRSATLWLREADGSDAGR